MKHTESEKKTSKSSGFSNRPTTSRILPLSSARLRFVVCVKSGGYVDLEPLKIYKVRHDPAAKAHGMIRVVDGSGENYLYPKEYFRPIQAPRGLFRLVKEAAR